MKNHLSFILAIIALLVCTAAEAKYSGGTGDPNDPYQIADVNDLLALAYDANDYGKCFILTADVNLAGQVFMKAIIAPDTSSSNGFQGTAFTGTFDGNSHKITNFIIEGNGYLGLFGQVYNFGSSSIKNLGLENFYISGYPSSWYVGGLVGMNYGSISNCYSTGAVGGDMGHMLVGGLVGKNGGSISSCCSTGAVSGGSHS